jgi:hypothetical protein
MKIIEKIKVYAPLITIVSIIIVFILVRQIIGGYNLNNAMHDFMGMTFIVFGAIKMLNWRGFVEAYGMYDIIAKHSRLYAYLYPLFEIGLGYLFLMQMYTIPACVATIILTGLSTISVIQELGKNKPFPCACLGAVFVLPMTWVTLFENLFMIGMSIALIWMCL